LPAPIRAILLRAMGTSWMPMQAARQAGTLAGRPVLSQCSRRGKAPLVRITQFRLDAPGRDTEQKSYE